MNASDRSALEVLTAEAARRQGERFRRYFPDCTPACRDPQSPKVEDHGGGFCRVLYAKHVRFMAAGREHNERLFLAANQIGKTECAAYEVTAHLTGRYPVWWEGHRFTKPIEAWFAGDTMLTTRNVLQVAMLGAVEGVETRDWTGMLPAADVVDVARKSGGVALCIDKVWVRHYGPDGAEDGESTFEFLSYDQGRKVFQGTGRDLIWLDEEPPDAPLGAASSGESNDIYSECLLRTITRNGLVIATFTPLRGLTPFVQRYLESAVMPDSEGVARPANDVLWPDESAA